ncbi:MAG: hypothetical protein ABIG61_04755 [Planctomycetota bacterium]
MGGRVKKIAAALSGPRNDNFLWGEDWGKKAGEATIRRNPPEQVWGLSFGEKAGWPRGVEKGAKIVKGSSGI